MFFKRKKYQYPPLSNNVKELLDYIDTKCVDELQSPVSALLNPTYITMPLQIQLMPFAIQKKYLDNQLSHISKDTEYMPRSIAYIQSGLDWVFIIGTRNAEFDQLKALMFIELLNDTNNRRSQ